MLPDSALWANPAAPAVEFAAHHYHPDATGPDFTTRAGDDDSVILWQFSPSPAVLTVTVGSTVTWTGTFGGVHPLQEVDGAASDTVLAGDGHFGFRGGGTAYAFRFDSAGVYFYRCGNHGVAQFGGTMRGKIVVVDEIAAPPRQQLFLPLMQQ
jgi:plastocyanin